MQASLELINLLSRGVPMAEAKSRLALSDTPSEESVSAGVSGEEDSRKTESAPADTTPPDEPTEDAPPVDAGAKPAWMP